MAYGMGNIAGMLASSGANIGANIGNPLAQFGQNIGGMLTARTQAKNKQQEAAEAQELLAQNKNNPAQLNALYQKYASEGRTDIANLFKQAAESAVNRAQKRVAGMEASRASADKRAELARARVDAMGDELTSMKEKRDAIKLALDNKDTKQAQAIRDGLLDPKKYVQDYFAKISKPAKPVSLSPGGALVSPTGEVLYERPFKPETPKEPKVSFQERDDGSLLVFEGSNLVQTIEPPEKGTNQEAAMDLITKSVFLQGQVDKLIQTIPTTGSGFLGGTVGKIPGTAGYDRDRDIINIKANLGFEQINEMKRQAKEAGASGTGLGQVSNIELLALQSTVDTLDIGMGDKAQVEALNNIKNHLRTVQLLASGVAPKDAIEWDTPTYKAAGYHQDPETGDVFFAPDGPSGTVYILRDGKFVNAGL